MGDVISKTKFFIFLSVICLLVNIVVCSLAYLQNEQDINEYTKATNYKMSGNIPPNNNITISNFASSTITSFVPYFSIINLAFLGLDLVTNTLVGIIITIIGTLQLFLIVTIILNMLPFFNV